MQAFCIETVKEKIIRDPASARLLQRKHVRLLQPPGGWAGVSRARAASSSARRATAASSLAAAADSTLAAVRRLASFAAARNSFTMRFSPI